MLQGKARLFIRITSEAQNKHMVLIISQEPDQITDDVAEWLDFKGIDFVRVNESDFVSNVLITLDPKGGDVSLCIDKKGTIKLSEVSTYWYRRGGFYPNLAFMDELPENLKSHLLEEWEAIHGFVHSELENIDGLDSFNKADVNKLTVLKIAQKLGIKIPLTWVGSQTDEIKAFYTKQEGGVITKSVQRMFSGMVDDCFFTIYTEPVGNSQIQNLPKGAAIFPSLFQQKVAKAYEIRSFYLCGDFYSMAIFSQNDAQTQTDFRKYNHAKPNRVCPFKLPEEVETKLDALMKKLELDTGSIDLICTPEGEFVFLEVNPVGQFGMVSYPCNYYLEKKVAEVLSQKSKYNQTLPTKNKNYG